VVSECEGMNKSYVFCLKVLKLLYFIHLVYYIIDLRMSLLNLKGPVKTNISLCISTINCLVDATCI
jgi:hypothetical protein